MRKILFIFFIFSFQLFATPYLEYCAGSQLKYKDAGAGGTGGHAFLYIEGLCKDFTRGYPQVIPCAQIPLDLLKAYPHTGVGISLDSEFKNVSWIAVPTKELAFSSGSINNIIKKSLKYKVFEGVELHNQASSLDAKLFSKTLIKNKVPHYVNSKGAISLSQKLLTQSSRSYQVFSTLYTVGTDIAVNTARDLACLKLELKDEASLDQIANFLNQTNQQYQSSNKPYTWHMLMNNCTHLALNTVNKAGFNTPYYEIEAFLRSGSLTHYAKALATNPRNTIKNMMTPADGFQLIKNRIPEAEVSYRPVLKSLNAFFDTSDLKVFSFNALNYNHHFTRDFLRLKNSKNNWLKRNVLYNNGFYKRYSRHFYKIKTLTQQ